MSRVGFAKKKERSQQGYGALFEHTRPSDYYQSENNSRVYRADSDGEDPGNISTDDGMSDMEMKYSSTDEFKGGRENVYKQKGTGRQRKKVASRGKGSEFQAKRKKRRAYACCIGSEIDTIKLDEYIKSMKDSKVWQNFSTEMYTDTLRIYRNAIAPVPRARETSIDESTDAPVLYSYSTGEARGLESVYDRSSDLAVKFNDPYCKEIFVYEFGAVVFWGFPAGEETSPLLEFRNFVSKGLVTEEESAANEDDMAFITMPALESTTVSISNDVMTMPDNISAKQRLAMSFAMGQSTVLAVFESRVESKVQDYKYIPETLALSGKIKIPSRKIGTMIGEIFVIRHDLNLHTDILDTPDFFWEEEKYIPDYKMLWRYLEMDGRVEVLNKRLDMLKELLDVLQQQMENAHASKLEWIVIWLIIIEVVIEVAAIMSGKMFS